MIYFQWLVISGEQSEITDKRAALTPNHWLLTPDLQKKPLPIQTPVLYSLANMVRADLCCAF